MFRIGQPNRSGNIGYKSSSKSVRMALEFSLLTSAVSLAAISAATAGSQPNVQGASQSNSANGATSVTSTTSTAATSVSASPSAQNQIETPAAQSSAPSSGSGQIFPATSREQALPNARRGAGRSDPLAPISGFKPFPSNSELETKVVETNAKGFLPQTRINESGGRPPILPPPPPVSVSSQTDFPVSELPLPPDRPSIASKLKLTGVIGDKAVFSITDREAIRINKWPAVVMMAPGDRFESIETVSVGADSAVLEEDGERSTKTLERIR